MSDATSARMGASGLDLDVVDKLLTTTHAVRRRLDLDRPVVVDVVLECLSLALQAPTGSNLQGWRWLVVTDPEVRSALGEMYRNPPDDAGPASGPPPGGDAPGMSASVNRLRDHLQDVPVLVVPCVDERGGAAGWAPSIYPTVWSFMLALRSRGLGSVLTTVHLFRRADADALLGVPEGYVQACLLPVAYFTGEDFRPADRRPVEEVAFLDHWDTPVRT